MTAADKLRELLATRPALPNTEQLVEWWRVSGMLVPPLLEDVENHPRVLASAWAALQREKDARAELRSELERVRADATRRAGTSAVPRRRWSTSVAKIKQVIARVTEHHARAYGPAGAGYHVAAARMQEEVARSALALLEARR